MNHSCTKTLPTGDVFTNDPNGYAVVDDLKLVYDIANLGKDALCEVMIKLKYILTHLVIEYI